MASIPRKSYVATREVDGTYAIHVTKDAQPAGVIPGFPTMDKALDECARLNALEQDRDGREKVSDA
jgi:hypothetical protein